MHTHDTAPSRLQRFQHFLVAPVFPENDDKTRIAANLFLTLKITIFSTILYLMILNPVLPAIYIVVGTGLLVLQIGFVFLLKQGYVRSIALALVMLGWMTAMLSAVDSGGVRALGYVGGGLLCIMIAGFLLHYRYVLMLLICTSAYGFLLAVLQSNNILAPPRGIVNPVGYVLIYTVVLAMSAGFAYLALRDIRFALDKARHELMEREHTKVMLAEREEQFRLISTVTSDYTFSARINADDRSEDAVINGAFEAITGYAISEYEAIGGWFSILHPDDWAINEEGRRQLRRNEKTIIEVRIIRKDGQMRWVRVYSYPVWDNEWDRLGSIYGAVQDITERKEAEMALREQEEQFRLISSMTSDYTFWSRFDPESRLEYVILTGAFEAMTGYSPDEFKAIGGWRSILHPEDIPIDDRALALLYRNEKAMIEVRIICKDGDIRWMRVYTHPVWDDDRDELVGIRGAGQDITARREAEEERQRLNAMLERQAGQLAILNEIAHDITAITDLETMLKRLLSKLQTILPVDAFFVALYDTETGQVNFPVLFDDHQFWAQLQTPLSPGGWVAQVINTGAPLIKNRTQAQIDASQKIPTRIGNIDRLSASILMTPLTRGDDTIGVISVQSYTLNAYNQDHLELLTSAGHQIAIAVENARLFESLQLEIAERQQYQEALAQINQTIRQQAEQQVVHNEIGREVSALTDLEHALQNIVAQFQKIIDFDACSIILYDRATDMLTYPVFFDSGTYWEIPPAPLPPDSHTAQILEKKEPILTLRTQAEIDKWSRPDLLRGDVKRVSASLLTAPMIIRERVIGAVSVQSYRLNAYDETDIPVVIGTAHQIAVAIETARLLDSLREELTERQRLERELQQYASSLEGLVNERSGEVRAAKEQLELILNTTTDALAFADTRGDIVIHNPAFTAMFTPPALESLEDMLTAVADKTHTDRLSEALHEVIFKQVHQHLELQIRSQSGALMDVDLTFIPIEGMMDDDRNAVLVSGHDITRLKALERFKARFVSEAVHDLAAPITGLGTRLYILKRSPEKLPAHVRALENQVTHLHHLLDNLRLYSELEDNTLVLEMAPCEISTVLQRVFDTYEPVAMTKSQTLTLHMDDTLPMLALDERQLERVLVNLVSNAINYSAKNETIRIKATQQAQHIQIQIIDRGMGISPEDLQHIFKRFYRAETARKTRARGSGLGLAISKEIVEMHGGTISVTSEVGQGSTFMISLPLSAK